MAVQFNIGTLPDQFRNAPKTRPVLDCGGKYDVRSAGLVTSSPTHVPHPAKAPSPPRFAGADRFHLSTDAMSGYCGSESAVKQVFGDTIDYATETKYFARPGAFLSRKVIGIRKRRRLGFPDLKQTTINHCERTNLSLRTFTRRFTRCTLGYSKKLENT
jgi:hypothetical protein